MSAIDDLEADALNSEIPVSTLLQRCLSLSVKLNRLDVSGWIESELHGYKKSEAIPEYRIVRGSLEAWDRYNGWIPARFRESQQEVARIVETHPMDQPMAQIEALIAGNKTGKGLITQLSDVTVIELRRAFKMDTNFRVAQPPGVLEGTTSGVRARIVKWLAELQRDTVNPDIAPSRPERKPASEPTPQAGMVFHGPVHNPIFQQATSSAHQTASSTAGAATVVSKGSWASELGSRIVKAIPENWFVIGLTALAGIGGGVYAWFQGWIQRLLQ